MSTPQQHSVADQAPVAAPRRLSPPVPAPRQIRGPEQHSVADQAPAADNPVFCSAPCCVQARGGERPPGPYVPQPVPLPAEEAEEDQGEGRPNPAPVKRRRVRERRRKRREEERIKRGFEHLPCQDHREEEEKEEGNDGGTNDDDDDSDIQTSDPKVEEDTKQKEVKPDFDDDATEFETEQDSAEQVDPDEVYDEAYESRDQNAAEVDGPEVEYNAVGRYEGLEDYGEENIEMKIITIMIVMIIYAMVTITMMMTRNGMKNTKKEEK